MGNRDVQRTRAAQVGLLMRSYRESFAPGDGRRGLTQEALLERMGAADSDYAERYSHATVSRWESGSTRPTLQRLKVFGKALGLSRTEVAGLILLAGMAPDFRTALGHVNGSGDVANRKGAPPDPTSAPALWMIPRLRQLGGRPRSSWPQSASCFSGPSHWRCA